MRYSKGHFINNHWQMGEGEVFHSLNPANGNILWQGHSATEEEVSEAVAQARAALPQWSSLSFEQRYDYTKKFADSIDKNRVQLATLISEETGKPLWESHTEVNSVYGKISLSAKAYLERNAEHSTSNAEGNSRLRYKPQGVVAVLGAYNFPAHLSNGHIVPALLAGNTVVYKPSELTPAVAEFIMQCWQATGIPAGVIQCIQGEVSTGKSLLTQNINGVYFTGSYNTGLSIHRQFADKPEIILALEMGGNNPLVIDNYNNLSATIYTIILSSMITSGQRCSCARRLIIPNSKAGDELLKQLKKALASLAIGAYSQIPEPFMGPLISRPQAQNAIDQQSELLNNGGNALLSMQLFHETGAFLSPGLIDMSSAALITDEEIFAPLLQIYRYDDFDEALEIANNTRYGLAAGLISNSEKHYQHFFRNIQAGLINWNRPTTGASGSLPFGGIGASGNHRPSAYFASDYCAYPIASLEKESIELPQTLLPGISVDCL